MYIRFFKPLSYLCSMLALSACDDSTQVVEQSTLQAPQINWYEQGQADIQHTIVASEKINNRLGSAKNIILFVGDGMGISTVTAARILDGQRKGQSGEENQLSFGQFPFSGLSKTYNVDAQTPDSAGTMTALITGVKTDAGVLGVNEKIQRGDCTSVAGNELVTALELAELAGMSTGIVTTARVTHATPGANYAKSADRDWEDVSDMPQAAINGGCKDIAQQLIQFEDNLKQRFPTANINGIEVVMGGGRRHFLPKEKQANTSDAVSDIEGDRTDGLNLISQWQSIYPQGVYVMDTAGFANIDPNKTQHVLGLFNESHMRYEADRSNDKAGEPSLSEMTKAAIEILDNNPNGFFLNVEAGRIDHGHHAGNAHNALTDAIELSHAVQIALENTNPEETLIIVTADHSHVFTMAGYPKRGNPILGKVVNVGKSDPALAGDGRPYTTLGYINGKGFHDRHEHTDADAVYDEAIVAGRHLTAKVDTQAPGFHQEALVPLESETHGGEDVGIYATGPGAHLVSGVHEQNYIFHVMNHAGGLTQKARRHLMQK
ncbi:MAG: alkaline phosphatase [Gammaproteobacteria bacterium]|nr:alkaline phosphatase [Gammaproteobacteria bacterium]